MSRRWRFTLVAMVITGLGAAPVLSSTTASAAPVPSKVAAASLPRRAPGWPASGPPTGSETHVVYVGADGQITAWYGNGTTWTNAALGTGEPAAVGTGLTATYSPDGEQAYVVYVGANGQPHAWSMDGKRWVNVALGTGEPAALGSGLTAFWTPNGKEATSSTSELNGQLYDRNGDGTKWTDAELGKGEAAALGTAPGRNTQVRQPGSGPRLLRRGEPQGRKSGIGRHHVVQRRARHRRAGPR